MMYQFLNYFFFVFHTALILFNLFGWLFQKLRKWNLLSLLLTAFSWFVIGIWHGWGYCPCTDWHWEIRKHLGYHDMSWSYNHFLIHRLTGIDLSEDLVNSATLVLFVLSLILSISVNLLYSPKKISARA